MYKRSLIQLSAKNAILLSRRQVGNRHIPIAMRSMSYQFSNRTNNGTLSPIPTVLSLCHSKRFYSEKSTTSTHGVDIPQEIISLPINVYHNEADKFLDAIFEQIEILSEDYPDLIPEVELNHGVMTLNLAKLGPYVINKQPPNKQIWFASPLSGPNRFDFYKNEWISLRDNTKLIDVINKEVRIAMPGHDINITKEIDE